MIRVHPLRFRGEIPGMARQPGCRFTNCLLFTSRRMHCVQNMHTFAALVLRGQMQLGVAARLIFRMHDRSPSSDRCPVLSCSMIF